MQRFAIAALALAARCVAEEVALAPDGSLLPATIDDTNVSALSIEDGEMGRELAAAVAAQDTPDSGALAADSLEVEGPISMSASPAAVAQEANPAVEPLGTSMVSDNDGEAAVTQEQQQPVEAAASSELAPPTAGSLAPASLLDGELRGDAGDAVLPEDEHLGHNDALLHDGPTAAAVDARAPAPAVDSAAISPAASAPAPAEAVSDAGAQAQAPPAAASHAPTSSPMESSPSLPTALPSTALPPLTALPSTPSVPSTAQLSTSSWWSAVQLNCVALFWLSLLGALHAAVCGVLYAAPKFVFDYASAAGRLEVVAWELAAILALAGAVWVWHAHAALWAGLGGVALVGSLLWRL